MTVTLHFAIDYFARPPDPVTAISICSSIGAHGIKVNLILFGPRPEKFDVSRTYVERRKSTLVRFVDSKTWRTSGALLV
jgi:hypothetical protein